MSARRPHWLERFWRGGSLFVDVPLPDMLWAVGDVHGCLDAYRALEARMLADHVPGQSGLIVLLGDIVDRGPDSSSVVAHLLGPAPEGVRRLCLMGNHEDMLLRFLAAPGANAAWLDYGGLETLASYGVGPGTGPNPVPEDLAPRLKAAMPPDHLAFLRRLPLGMVIGRHVLCHAGTAPGVSLARQRKADLIWPRYGEVPDLAPPVDLGARILVHGHVPVPEAYQHDWRINLDTGVYASGRLSAARLYETGAPEFVFVGP